MSSKVSSLDQGKDFRSQLWLMLWTALDAVPENDPLLRRVTGKVAKPCPLGRGHGVAQQGGLEWRVPPALGVLHWRRRELCEVSALLLHNPWLQIKLMPSAQKRDCVCAPSQPLPVTRMQSSAETVLPVKFSFFPLPWDLGLKLAVSQQGHPCQPQCSALEGQGLKEAQIK